MKTAVFSALAIAATTSFALAAEPINLTADQLDKISAGKTIVVETLGASGNPVKTPGQGGNGTTTTTTKGNTKNTNCSGCGTVGPGNK